MEGFIYASHELQDKSRQLEIELKEEIKETNDKLEKRIIKLRHQFCHDLDVTEYKLRKEFEIQKLTDKIENYKELIFSYLIMCLSFIHIMIYTQYIQFLILIIFDIFTICSFTYRMRKLQKKLENFNKKDYGE